MNGAPYVSSASPWEKSVARTSSAIRPAWSVSAAIVAGSVAVQRRAMRSATSRPLFLRASWIRRIASRARPARRSSSVSSRSSATVAPESEATDQPSRGVSVMITSSGARVIVSPSTSTDAVPSRRARESAAASAPATAFATSWTRLPNRLPSARKLAFAVVSTREPPTSLSDARDSTFSSSVICACNSGESASKPATAIRARLSGWRVLTPDSARVARPSSTRRRTRTICCDSSGSIAVRSASGHEDRWTDSGAPGVTGTTRSCQTRSVMNGVSGAISLVTVSTTSCRVRSAALSPCQKRRRERRTYQLDRSSTNADSSLPARWVSYESSAWVTWSVSACSSESSQRSRTGRSAGAGSAALGAQPEVRAYRAWKATVFQYVRSVLRTTSWMVPWPTRRAAQGEPPAAMNQRTASAPCWSISGIGCRMLPRCLDILRPSSARMWPRQTTFS